MTLGVNPSSIPENPKSSDKSCNSRFLHHLSTIGAAVLGVFLTSNPMRADTSYSMDLSQRSMVPRSEVVANEVPPDESLDSDDEMDVGNMGCAVTAGAESNQIDPQYNYGFLFIAHHPVTQKDVILIGTHHGEEYTPIALQNPFLPKIIKHCERVYTEMGNTRGLKTDDPEPMTFDSVIGQTALRENKALVRLDKNAVTKNEYTAIFEEEEPLFSAQERMYELLNDTDRFDQQLMTEIEMYFQDLDDLEEFEQAWRDGDVEIGARDRAALKRFPRLYEKMFTSREKNWLATLSKDLRSSEDPICIAVGSSHLVGEDGLVAELQKMGFVVTQSTFSACVR